MKHNSKKKTTTRNIIIGVLVAVLVVGVCLGVLAIVKHIGNTQDNDAPVVNLVATFDFGENTETAEHNDGEAATDVLKFNDGQYTLTLTELVQVYSNAFDAVGNSCLKIGSSSNIGSFTFAVPSNVATVIIHIAGYKDKTAKVSFNQGEIQVIESLSCDGEYTAIQIKVPQNHTITIATAIGGTRAMIDRIEFIG